MVNAEHDQSDGDGWNVFVSSLIENQFGLSCFAVNITGASDLDRLLAEETQTRFRQGTTRRPDLDLYSKADAYFSSHLGVRMMSGSPIFFGPYGGERDIDELVQYFIRLSFTYGRVGRPPNPLTAIRLDAEQRRVLDGSIRAFPTPIFGSPPDLWRDVESLIRAVPSVALVGIPAAADRPVLAVASAAGAFIYWFTKPSLRVARRAVAQVIADRLEVELRPEDER